MHFKSKVERCLLIPLLLAPVAAQADDDARFGLDLTVGRSGLSTSHLGVPEGLERPDGYELGLRGVRLVARLDSSLEAFVSREVDPWYEWGSLQAHLQDGPAAESWWLERRELETFEAGLGWQVLDRGRWTVSPRAGIIHLELDGRPASGGIDPQPGWSREFSTTATAEGSLWGVSAAVEVGWRPVQDVEGVARVGGRWATGPVERRETSIELFTVPGEPSEQTVVTLERTRTEDVAALTVELGAAWDALPWLVVEAGWQYRDWQLDQSSAATDSPYLRLGLRL